MVNLIVNSDGGARGNSGPAGIGLVIQNVKSDNIDIEISKYIGEATNNQAEYTFRTYDFEHNQLYPTS